MRKNGFHLCCLIATCLLALLPELLAEEIQECEQIVTAIAPAYPRLARLTRTSGEIRVRVDVDASGTVINANAIKEDINAYVSFKDSSEKAALRWKFAAESRKSMQRHCMIKFNFKIMPDETPEDELISIYRNLCEIEVRNTAANPHKFEDPLLYHDK